MTYLIIGLIGVAFIAISIRGYMVLKQSVKLADRQRADERQTLEAMRRTY